MFLMKKSVFPGHFKNMQLGDQRLLQILRNLRPDKPCDIDRVAPTANAPNTGVLHSGITND